MRSSQVPSGWTPRLVLAAVAIYLFSGAQILFAADPPPAGATRSGRGGRGGPLTAEDQSAIAKLAALPAWKPGQFRDGRLVLSGQRSTASAARPGGKWISGEQNLHAGEHENGSDRENDARSLAQWNF